MQSYVVHVLVFDFILNVVEVSFLLQAIDSFLVLQDKDISSRTSSRRLSSLSIGKSLDGKSNKGSFIITHNEVGEQLWLRTIDGSGRAQVIPLPPNGTAAIKLPTSRRLQDPDTKKMASKQFGKFVALRIGDSEVSRLHLIKSQNI